MYLPLLPFLCYEPPFVPSSVPSSPSTHGQDSHHRQGLCSVALLSDHYRISPTPIPSEPWDPFPNRHRALPPPLMLPPLHPSLLLSRILLPPPRDDPWDPHLKYPPKPQTLTNLGAVLPSAQPTSQPSMRNSRGQLTSQSSHQPSTQPSEQPSV